jgi:predicted  nucleic acid-binding Zn-ribbon protein
VAVTVPNLSSRSMNVKLDPNEPASNGIIGSSSVSTVSSVDRNDKDYLQRKIKEQAMDLKLAQSTIAELREELRKLQQKLQDAKSESSGLRVTLGDVMEKHDAIQKRSDETMKRLFSLQISLDSMMEHQNILSSVVKNRNEKMKDTSDKRQALFAQLLEIDADTLFEEDKLDASISKQTREMEAIAAVIKAARE